MRRIPFGLPFHKVHFSSDKEVIVKNVAQHSLVAQRVFCDHVQSAGGVPQAAFCKELLLSAASGMNDFKVLKSSVEKYAEKAKGSGNLTFIAKSNRMRKTAIEKEE